jgi:hypothetical protein
MVSPANRDGAVPEKVSDLPRMPEAFVCTVMPLPVVETVMSPVPGSGVVVVAVVVVTGDPPGRPVPPTVDAGAAAGRASAAISSAETA